MTARSGEPGPRSLQAAGTALHQGGEFTGQHVSLKALLESSLLAPALSGQETPPKTII